MTAFCANSAQHQVGVQGLMQLFHVVRGLVFAFGKVKELLSQGWQFLRLESFTSRSLCDDTSNLLRRASSRQQGGYILRNIDMNHDP
jgi:hypothetical protein